MDVILYFIFLTMSLWLYSVYAKTKPEMAYLGVFAGLVFIFLGIFITTGAPIDSTFCFEVNGSAHCETVDIHTGCDTVTAIGLLMIIIGMGACVDVVSFHQEHTSKEDVEAAS